MFAGILLFLLLLILLLCTIFVSNEYLRAYLFHVQANTAGWCLSVFPMHIDFFPCGGSPAVVVGWQAPLMETHITFSFVFSAQ